MIKTDRKKWMELAIKAQQRIDEVHKRLIDVLMKNDPVDEDGYPTENTLLVIELWPWEDEIGWFKFIESIWSFHSFGWAEGAAPHDYDKNKVVYLYEISTAGWSGNEAIIRAMEKNDMMWHLHWVQSRRGGHYIFERNIEEQP